MQTFAECINFPRRFSMQISMRFCLDNVRVIEEIGDVVDHPLGDVTPVCLVFDVDQDAEGKLRDDAQSSPGTFEVVLGNHCIENLI
jgi:hypothetical protein